MRIDPNLMTPRGTPVRQLRPLPIPDADPTLRGFIIRPFGDIDGPVATGVQVGGKLQVSPLSQEISGRLENLDSVVPPITYVDQPVLVNPKAVGRVELARSMVSRFTPGSDEPALGGEPVDPAVSVAIGDIQVSPGRGRHSGRPIERSR